MPRRGRHQGDLDPVGANGELIELARRADRAPQPGEAASQDKDPLHALAYPICGVCGGAGGCAMAKDFGAGFHVAPGEEVDTRAYEAWTGRWSRLFVPSVLAAARVARGDRVLDVSTGTGEAAHLALPLAGEAGIVVGADISPAMLRGARARLRAQHFLPVAGDGQALPFANASFDSVICHLGLQFFPRPTAGLAEFRRVLRPGK